MRAIPAAVESAPTRAANPIRGHRACGIGKSAHATAAIVAGTNPIGHPVTMIVGIIEIASANDIDPLVVAKMKAI